MNFIWTLGASKKFRSLHIPRSSLWARLTSDIAVVLNLLNLGLGEPDGLMSVKQAIEILTACGLQPFPICFITHQQMVYSKIRLFFIN